MFFCSRCSVCLIMGMFCLLFAWFYDCLFIFWLIFYFCWVIEVYNLENIILILKCSWTKFDVSCACLFLTLHPESQMFFFLSKRGKCFVHGNIWSYANHEHRSKPDIIFLYVPSGEKSKAVFCCWCCGLRVCYNINDDRPSGQSASFTRETRRHINSSLSLIHLRVQPVLPY